MSELNFDKNIITDSFFFGQNNDSFYCESTHEIAGKSNGWEITIAEILRLLPEINVAAKKEFKWADVSYNPRGYRIHLYTLDSLPAGRCGAIDELGTLTQYESVSVSADQSNSGRGFTKSITQHYFPL